MDTGSALEALQAAVDRCSSEDVDTAEIGAAMDFLQERTKVAWPFEQFRAALKTKPGEDWEIEGRRQILSASLNGIRRAV